MIELNGKLTEMALLAMAAEFKLVGPPVKPALPWLKSDLHVRSNVTTLRALRRVWLPMWSLREDDNGRNIRRAARAIGAHLDRTARVRAW